LASKVTASNLDTALQRRADRSMVRLHEASIGLRIGGHVASHRRRGCRESSVAWLFAQAR
jgi:hypothetical protein